MQCLWRASSSLHRSLAEKAGSTHKRRAGTRNAYAGAPAAAASTASLARQAAETRAPSPVKATPSDSSSVRLRRTLGVSSPCTRAAEQSGQDTPHALTLAGWCARSGCSGLHRGRARPEALQQCLHAHA